MDILEQVHCNSTKMFKASVSQGEAERDGAVQHEKEKAGGRSHQSVKIPDLGGAKGHIYIQGTLSSTECKDKR